MKFFDEIVILGLERCQNRIDMTSLVPIRQHIREQSPMVALATCSHSGPSVVTRALNRKWKYNESVTFDIFFPKTISISLDVNRLNSSMDGFTTDFDKMLYPG